MRDQVGRTGLPVGPGDKNDFFRVDVLKMRDHFRVDQKRLFSGQIASSAAAHHIDDGVHPFGKQQRTFKSKRIRISAHIFPVL